MADRIKPQLELSTTDYEKFRLICGELPVRWVIEGIVQAFLDSENANVCAIVERIRGQVRRGERRISGRPVGRRDSFKR